eukprot:TRINITY_DN13896_c0_g1_i1.p1 TRINITY_DN13896_c0_g1~~TRINITY_DN13896_c0_g1_i1.p1  ORF type:complete len:165 (-),score=25.87 TRINITY_DN13896_c0_g1_i1:203-646(-)
MNAVAACGLQLYNFGQTISIPFFTETWRPSSFFDKIKINKNLGLHTLCLLDIKVKERSEENILKDLDIFEPPRFMSINVAIEQLLEVAEKRTQESLESKHDESSTETEYPEKSDCSTVYDENTLCVGLARVGQDDQKIVSGKMKRTY